VKLASASPAWPPCSGWPTGSTGAGAAALAEAVRRLAVDPARRAELGAFARRLVVDRFSLTAAAATQEAVYAEARARRSRTTTLAADAARAGAGLLGYKVRRKIQAWRGTAAVDDANARPVVAVEPPRRSTTAA